jgi:hypothetical protein
MSSSLLTPGAMCCWRCAGTAKTLLVRASPDLRPRLQANPVYPGPDALGYHRRQPAHTARVNSLSPGSLSATWVWRMRSIGLRKTQAALLEAMQERSVTVGRTRTSFGQLHVFATQNRSSSKEPIRFPRRSWTVFNSRCAVVSGRRDEQPILGGCGMVRVRRPVELRDLDLAGGGISRRCGGRRSRCGSSLHSSRTSRPGAGHAGAPALTLAPRPARR